MENVAGSNGLLQSISSASESTRNLNSPSDCSSRSPGNVRSVERKESPERSDSGAEESLVNPPPPAELGEDECAVLRGDAIGNTAYTQRWVLNTLLVITRSLPYYLNQDEMEIKTMDTEDSDKEVKESDPLEDERPVVLELAEDVESAACQLWDMTVEPDVVNHLLNLAAVDVLQLATDIITLSRAPRLTEVVVGVVANLCCQEEGCKRIVNHQALLHACLSLPQVTDDVPTLTEAFRFLRLMLWHLSHRIPMSAREECSLIMALKGHEGLKVALVFILKNSLSEVLLSAVIQFLELLLYLWLPADKCYMAAHYAESGIVEGVVEVMRHLLKQNEKSGGQELPKEVHKGILILYSFVGTSEADLISSFDQYESLLEPILVSYIEHIAKVECIEELLEGENAERLTYALGLCELLVPNMRHPSFLSCIGKLLVLTHGANHPYATPQGKYVLATPIDEKVRRRLRRSRSRRSRTSQEQMETETPGSEQRKKSTDDDDFGKEDQKSLGKGKALFRSSSNSSEVSTTNLPINESTASTAQESTEGASCFTYSGSSVEKNSEVAGGSESSKETKESNSVSTKLSSLVESLIDYCVRVLKYSRDLFSVLTALNECHVDEVLLFFRLVRSREPKLVGDIQEKLLDMGSHNRLITILADMYS